MNQPSDYAARDELTPRPDPTRLTTELVDRAVATFREVIETRLGAMDKATELLAATVGRVPTETDQKVGALRELLGARIDGMDTATKLLAGKVDQTPTDTDRAVAAAMALLRAEISNVGAVSDERFTAIDRTFASNALALTAALAAQEKAVAEQNNSNTLAITKSEQATKETISANAAQTTAGLTAQASNLQDIKERVVRLEAGGLARSDSRTESRLNLGSVVGAIGLIVAVISVTASIIIASR